MDRIDANLYLNLIRGGAAALAAHRQTVNDLNVFPIPDGDTGDNMFMTIQAGCHAAGSSLPEMAKAVSAGMLMGARGNSGVILSRIYAGIAKGLEGVGEADVETLSRAMLAGVEESYHAVSEPVEGTILTVFREGAQAAAGSKDLKEYFDQLVTSMNLSLQHTPELLDVLNAFTEDSVLEFGYCTEFILRLQRSKVNLDTFDETVLSDWLSQNGESLVFFRDGSIVKVHVHTRTPGDILNHCQQYGEFLTLKVENMTLQHHENHMDERFKQGRKAYGVVTVASGAGLAETFQELGADVVIEGGQTMNPSVERFIQAFNEIDADTIFVLPNNSNILLTARQAAELYDKADIRVIPCKTLGEGYYALANMDAKSDDANALEAALTEAAGEVVTGLVSRAIRDSGNVKEGDYVGISGKEILASGATPESALMALADALGAGSSDVLLVFAGADAVDAQCVRGKLESMYPRSEVILQAGGQPVYEYILVLI